MKKEKNQKLESKKERFIFYFQLENKKYSYTLSLSLFEFQYSSILSNLLSSSFFNFFFKKEKKFFFSRLLRNRRLSIVYNPRVNQNFLSWKPPFRSDLKKISNQIFDLIGKRVFQSRLRKIQFSRRNVIIDFWNSFALERVFTK